jgi:branched-chain amino acid transport system substrate-binding protein
VITRRELIKNAAATGVLAGTSGLAMPAVAQNAPIKLGYVSPQSGPLAAFAEADKFIIDGFLAATKAAGLNYEVVVKDSQSNPNRAAEVAKELIVNDKVNLMLVASTPETTNPVATTCEAEEVPCLSTVAPWQPWFIGQQGNPGDPASWKPFNYAYHFFWGLEDIIAVLTNMWAQVETNKKVGGLFPNDGDGIGRFVGLEQPRTLTTRFLQLAAGRGARQIRAQCVPLARRRTRALAGAWQAG